MDLSSSFLDLTDDELAATRLALERQLAADGLGELTAAGRRALEKTRELEPRGC
jgi:hypothetical protein